MGKNARVQGGGGKGRHSSYLGDRKLIPRIKEVGCDKALRVGFAR